MTKREDEYTPVSCAEYDAYEIAILHHQRLRVTWHDNDGLDHIDSIMPRDLVTQRHREYLIATGSHGMALRLRLDRIIRARPC